MAYLSNAALDGNDLAVKRPARPKGFDSFDAFLEDMRENYETGASFDDHNRRAGQEDAKFVAGNQWDPVVEEKRKRAKKPVLTFNRLIAFIAQIVGNRLMNETEIRVYPDKAGTKEIALIREGIIRSIYKNSDADLARNEANKYQVIGGTGYFCLSIDYAGNDVFEQKIGLKTVADPYSVVMDPLSIDPTGGDAEWGFVGDDIPLATYKKRYPWAAPVSFQSSRVWNQSGYWLKEETIRVVSYWRMVTEGFKTLALFADGTVQDVTEKEEYEYVNEVALRDDGSPYLRDVPNRFARMYICSGNDVLEGPYDYPMSSLPIYRVAGWEVNDGERCYRWGLTRFLKDPQRLHNYWRSTIAEQLVAAPRNKWLSTPDAVKGFEKAWRASPTSDDPFLYYNDGETAPIHIPPPGIDAALITEAGAANQDMKDISNIHEASLGMPSNEVSKVAIQQRQQVSDVGSFIYSDRMRMADERCATNINELIPYIYDTQRVEMIIGRDGKMTQATINSNQETDVTLGKYGVTVTVGPATVTKRQLASEQMTAFMNAIGPAAEKYLDLFAEAQDFPQADEFARRARIALPDGMVSEEDMSPEEKAARQSNQQMQQLQQQLAQAGEEAKILKLKADASNAEARARLAEAQAYKAIIDGNARMKDVDSKIDERDHDQVMAAIDQHNDMLGEDRAFDASEEDRKARATGEQGNEQGS